MSEMQPERTTNVLIIDADNVRRGMLACTLPAARYSLEFASSAEKGLDLLVRLEPEVVIVGGDREAHELCQRVRSLPAGTACTLVLMDERFRDEDLGNAEAGAVGADTYLPFPFEANLLAQQLEAPAPMSRPTPLTTTSVDVSPAVALDVSQPGEEPRRPDPAAAWQAFSDKVSQIHAKLDSVDYYKLLQVSRNGTANAIKEAYFSCSIEYHPDRFMRLENQELKGQIYDIYKRMSEAFKVLINTESRTRYDDNLAGSPKAENLRLNDRRSGRFRSTPKDPTADAVTAAGKKYLHHAILAQSEGKYRSARMYLSLALQYEPDNEALLLRLDEVTQQL